MFTKSISQNGEELINCIKRKKTPERVHFIELFLDGEIQEAICNQFGLLKELNSDDPFFEYKKQIKLQRFLGYDYVVAGLDNLDIQFNEKSVKDTSGLERDKGRTFVDESIGPITTWEEFEKFPWPNLKEVTTRKLEYYNSNLPDDMIIIGGLTGHVAEYLMWFMGYETLCIALFENPELVKALYEKIVEINCFEVDRLLEFDRVKIIWGSDDMGFKTGPLLSPDNLREYVLPVHKMLAEKAHNKERLYILHSCGKLDLIMDDLINDVKIDAKHSYEDTIEDVCDLKENGYGQKIALLGGIDVDFLCNADEDKIRERVRNT